MELEHRQQLSASFGGVAEIYERYRPSYPDDAVRWLVGDNPRAVLDLAAGTGKLTRSLLAMGHDVVAADPSEPMLMHLTMEFEDADVRVGSAEAIPLADASVDVVTVAQAFHWFDPEPAVREIRRVLRPDGHLALVWNLRDTSVPWVDELWKSINSGEPATATDLFRLPDDDLFGTIESATFAHRQLLDRDGLRGLVASRSYVATQSSARRAALIEAAGTIYDRYAGDGGITVPYVVHCFRVPVRPAGGRL